MIKPRSRIQNTMDLSLRELTINRHITADGLGDVNLRTITQGRSSCETRAGKRQISQRKLRP